MVSRAWLVIVCVIHIMSVALMGIWSLRLRESNSADQYSEKRMKPYATKLTTGDP